MNSTRNVFLKLFILLTSLAGWSGSAWADAVFVRPTYVSSTNANPGQNEGPEKMFDGNLNSKWGMGYTNGTTRPSVVAKVEGGMVLRAYKLFNGGDTHSYPDRRWKKWTIEGSNDQTNWSPIHTIYDGRMNDVNKGENLYTVKNNNTSYVYYRITVLNSEGNGMIQMSEMQFSSSPLTEFPILGNNVGVSFVGGSPLVKYHDPESENPITITAGTQNFGGAIYDRRFLEVEGSYLIQDVAFNNAAQSLVLTFAPNPNGIRFSPAPVGGVWDADTHWFTMRNNRTSYGGGEAAKWNRKYLTVAADGVRDDHTLTIEHTPMNVAPTDRGGYWCFVGNVNGFKIQNAAYGPEFYFAYLGNNKYTMVHKDAIPNGAVVDFTYNDQSTQKDGASVAYIFRIGTSGWNHIHCNNNNLIAWAPSSWQTGDTGSAFTLTLATAPIFDALPKYDVYHVNWTGAAVSGIGIEYADGTKAFGKRGSANNGDYLIVEKDSPVGVSDFTVSGSEEYKVIKAVSGNLSGHACKDLTLTLADALATAKWTVRVSDGYAVSYAGNEYRDGETFMIRPTMTPKHLDFTVNAPAEKFVWGPVIDNYYRTVTFDVRDKATELETGLYQLSLKGQADITTAQSRISLFAENENTNSHYIYLAPSVHKLDGAQFKFTGVPTYSGEPATYVYINKRSATHVDLMAVGGAALNNLAYTYANGEITFTGYGIKNYTTKDNQQTIIYEPKEMPSFASGAGPVTFTLTQASLTAYDSYYIRYDGDYAPSARLTYKKSTPTGFSDYGKDELFIVAKGTTLTAEDFVMNDAYCTAVEIVRQPTATDPGELRITLAVATEKYTVHLTGDTRADDRAEYHEHDYADGETVQIAITPAPTALDFKTNVTDRFVWGPVFDHEAKTVTFEIKTPVNVTASSGTPLTTDGWYQFMLVPYNATGRNFINNVNNASNRAKSRKGSYIYMFNADKEYLQDGTKYYPVKFAAVPSSGDQTTSFLYVKANGSRPQFQAMNGHYINDSGIASNNPAGMQNMAAVNNQDEYGQNIYAIYRWFRYDTGSDEQPYMGASGTGLNFYVRAVKVNPDDLYDIYQVNLSGTGQNTVKYIGSGNRGLSEVLNNGYFFLDKNSPVPTKEHFKFDGLTTINSVTITTVNGVKTITFSVTSPVSTLNNTIIHRQHALYDRLETISDDLKPGSNYIKQGEGMQVHPNAANFTGAGYTDNDRHLQNTSVFRITQYTKPGTRTECVLPYTKAKSPSGHLEQYQRWYDYETERCLDAEILRLENGNSTLGNFVAFTNGHCNYNASGKQYSVYGKADLKLPVGKTEIYVGVDASEFQDARTNVGNGNLVEPSLNMRVIYHIISAHEMARELTTSGNKWWEEKSFYVPNVKQGSDGYKNNADLIPLEMPFSNYWIYKRQKSVNETLDDRLMPIVAENGNYNTLRSNLEIVVEGSAKEYLEVGVFDGNPGGIGGAAYINSNHFIYYKVKGSGVTRRIPEGAQAVIKVYAKEGADGANSPKFQLAKFTLNFQSDCEPMPITSVIGNPASTRSVDYFLSKKFKEVASMTFEEKELSFSGLTSHRRDENEANTYAFPIDFSRTSYGFSSSYTFGNYSVTRQGWGIKYQPVALYERNIKNPSNTSMDIKDDYFFYIDAAEAPGQVASVPLEGTLCAGTRLYCYGWLGSGNAYNGGGDPCGASVIVELIGRDGLGKEHVIASYLSGTLTDISYDLQGNTMRSLSYGRTPSMEKANYMTPSATQVGVWNSIGFSFVVKKDMTYASYEMRIINNCFSTAGGDYSLDDFRVFASPPKGEVDFTVPLCSDKVRHAKIHADYDALHDLSGVNDSNPEATFPVTYCFVDAEIFDNYTENGLTIKDMFDIDETGNHILKDAYDVTTPAVENIINHAFRDALVGSRYLKQVDQDGNLAHDDFGYHTYDIGVNYEKIDSYAYNDSKSQFAYREQKGDGVRRIVFKEDIVRGEMTMVKEEDENHPAYWPHLRPSRTYYLMLTQSPVTQTMIDDKHTATRVFEIHTNCSFFGKFTTKDPMHVIADNAEIEADLPVRAICHGESAEFQFDMPALKADKPIYDEEYCTSDHGLDDKIVPSTQGTHHYHYEAVFDDAEVQGIIKNLPYDWWLGGTLGGVSYGGRIEDYKKATHPTIKYAGPQDIKHKQDGDFVNIAQAMIDFRFFYPDFGEGKTDIFGNCSLTDADWAEVRPHDYNHDTGYGLLQSEINTIKDFVKAGIIVLHRNTFDMPLTLEKSDQLTLAELTDMSESELSTQILGLALKLNDGQLKDLESSVLNTLTDDGRTSLTFEVLNTVSETELREMATAVLDDLTEEEAAEMKLSDLRKAVESKLKEIAETDPAKLRELAIQHFPDIEHDERAYLVIRALNIMSREALAGLSPAELENTAYTRQLLREKMIEVFSVLAPDHLRKMWDDAKKKLTDEDAAELLGDKTPESMNAQQLATLVEHALAKITDEIISELNTDKYIHFTLLPIMPSQENFVDEPYIFCPDPRGVKIRVTTNSPRMLDGFADMPYPDDMDNVPVRVGLSQITAVSYDDAADAKTLRMPLRKLGSAQKSGTHEMHLQGSGYADYLYLVETDDPAYQYGEKKAGEMKPALLIEGGKPGDEDAYHLVAKVKQLQASYADSNNFMDLQFDPAMKFREGYTYRLAFNFMEFDEENAPTISCYGTMLFDMKVVPEYQKWTGAAGDDWTNDDNWQRADRDDLLADRKPVGNVIAGATDITSEDDYPTNDDNETAGSFIPMKFTNTLIATGADRMPHLYDVTPAHRRYTDKDDKVVEGAFATLNAETATDEAKYDMEVYDADGSWHGKGHYECGLFGTYVAKGITFEPATMLYNAHLLDYRKAWVEYELDANRNYTLSSPLQQTYSGEWYAPTSADNEAERGRQLTPHFYDIVYKTDLNDRFDPAFYQRSWDTGTSNIYRCMEGDHKPSYLPTQPVINQYRALDWSRYYNDVAVDYSKGGFNIRPSFGLRKQDDGTFYRREAKVLVRLPKEDAEYNYYDKTPAQNTPQEQHESQQATPLTRDDDKHYRLFTDVIASQDVLTQTLSNEGEWSNDYYLVGNPFMAPLDMNKFFAANPDLTPGMYWLMHSDLQIASLEIDGDWQSTTGDDAHPAVAPLQGFFVKRSAGTGNYTPLQVKFTPEMQYVPKENETLPTLKARANAPAADGVLRIEASDDMGRIQSVAAVTFVTGAHDAYVTGEDAELLLDSNVADRLATVFTTAGEQAMQFNVLSTAATFVPFGVIAPDDETVSHLSFSGLSAFAALTDGDVNLYDAATGVFSPVDDGTVLTVEGNSSGRFFLVAGMKIPYTGLDAAPSDEDPTDRYNLHGIRVATPQRGNVTIRTNGRKEYSRR